ncbi:YheE family protein [Rossellomorea sp. BNER]|uniref:YheE family protein n=1 Tax=Rossellomorea sp. BNER TaxID=2962031 RepID=UPI003AF25C74|nr:YheE family protein [Rossellomorea sp. BNER]
MISHFQFKNMYNNKQLPGWVFSFYFKGIKYEGNYHKNGEIEWIGQSPGEENQEFIKKQIHELMLFHVYE